MLGPEAFLNQSSELYVESLLCQQRANIRKIPKPDILNFRDMKLVINGNEG